MNDLTVVEIEAWVRPSSFNRSGSYRTYLLPVVQPTTAKGDRASFISRMVIYDGSLTYYDTAVRKLCENGYHIYDPAVDDRRA